MLRFHGLYEDNWVQLHREMREKTTKCLDPVEKWDGRSFPETKGSGEHWLRPVVRAIASEPRRSFALRALPLSNSTLLARKLGFSPALSWASRSAPYPFEPSPPARRRRADAHGSESRQSLHCLPSEQ